MRLNRSIWLAICAGVALGILITSLFLTPKVGGEYVSPIPTISEEPTPTPTSNPKLQPKYNSGKASYYDRTYCEKHNPSCITASGEVFDDTAFTCACASWFSLGSLLKVTHQENSIIVRCNDRGGFEAQGRILDLSKASFEALSPLSQGIIKVKVEVAE